LHIQNFLLDLARNSSSFNDSPQQGKKRTGEEDNGTYSRCDRRTDAAGAEEGGRGTRTRHKKKPRVSDSKQKNSCLRKSSKRPTTDTSAATNSKNVESTKELLRPTSIAFLLNDDVASAKEEELEFLPNTFATAVPHFFPNQLAPS